MSESLSFKVGANVSKNFAKSVTRSMDRTAMDEILEEAKKGSVEDMDNLFGEIVKRVSPENQQAALSVVKAHKDTIIREKEKKIKDQKKIDDKKELKVLGKNLLDANPNDPITKGLAAIFDSDLEIADIIKLSKNFTDAVKGQAATVAANRPPASSTKTVDPYRDTKENRAENEAIFKSFDRLLKEAEYDVAHSRGDVKKEKIKVLADIRKKRAAYMDKVAGVGGGQIAPTGQEQSQKVVFDFKNPEHIQVFTFLDKQFKGDKKKVTEAIKEQFIVN